jgi:HAD superfamily hydrolase (TIGR01509 family)
VPKYDAILFDFDGVLADTEPLHWKCWQQALAPLGVQIDRTTYEANCVGIADQDLLPFFASRAATVQAPERFREAYERKRLLYRSAIGSADLVHPGVRELLKYLNFTQVGIVTSSFSYDIEPLLTRAGVRNRVAALVGAEQVRHKKPHPEAYLLAASILRSEFPLVVEDSEAGEEAARAARFAVVRVRCPEEVPAAVRKALELS